LEDFKSFKEEMQGAVKQLNNSVETLKTENNSLKNSVNILKTENNSLKNSVDTIQNNNEILAQKVTAMDETLALMYNYYCVHK
jgi:cell division protein FtsB